MILSNISPKNVFKYFEEICGIPHGSGNTDEISNYCVQFAIEHGLWYRQDEFNNIIIKKTASKSYEDHKSVIIQGHLDMVCEKLPDVDINFNTDPLRIRLDNGFISAEGTTLGGDDGIAIAMALAVLEDSTLQHPDIYAVFTVDEETAMTGAMNIDLSDVPSRILLNIDSEQEGILTVSCAGGARCESRLSLLSDKSDKNAYRLSLSGLTGGHSGVEIHKNRLNANVVISNLLKYLLDNNDILLADIKGGTKDNAITRECECVILTASNINIIKELCDQYISTVNKDNDIGLDLKVTAEKVEVAFNAVSTEKAIELLNSYPYGVIKMSDDIEGLVETSLNFGVVRIENSTMIAVHSVRSSKNAEKLKLIENLKNKTELYGGDFSVSGQYPAWEYREDSRLRDTMIKVYKKLYGKTPVIEAIHAGLECGLLGEKLPGLDAVSFGPNIYDIHTPDERLDVESVERAYNYLCEILKEL